jgi:hypothetical protein
MESKTAEVYLNRYSAVFLFSNHNLLKGGYYEKDVTRNNHGSTSGWTAAGTSAGAEL